MSPAWNVLNQIPWYGYVAMVVIICGCIIKVTQIKYGKDRS